MGERIFDIVNIFDNTVLYTTDRISEKDTPNDWYIYWLRTGGENNRFAALTCKIPSENNCDGTIIAQEPFEIHNNDEIILRESDMYFYEISGSLDEVLNSGRM